MRAMAIVLMGVGGAAQYGIVHDQITVRVCLEYFTIGHPKIIDSESPTLLALAWGVVATWWVGLPLGICLAIAARAGGRPRLGPMELVRPMLVLLGAMLTLAIVAGIAGYLAASGGLVVLLPPLSDRVPEERHVAYLAALWMHLASYGSGVLGGIVLCVRTWRKRGAAGRDRTS